MNDIPSGAHDRLANNGMQRTALRAAAADAERSARAGRTPVGAGEQLRCRSSFAGSVSVIGCQAMRGGFRCN
jgi:hypothetical protein